MLAAKFSGNFFVNLLGTWAVSILFLVQIIMNFTYSAAKSPLDSLRTCLSIRQ